jgi:hypothetical protein
VNYGTGTPAVQPAYTPAAPTCTCLVKEYAQDGSVVFRDNCTGETASAPADGNPPA